MFAERRRIVDLWKRGESATLATLVGVEGSSYRRPGARLLIAKDGAYAGAISGGCLETEVLRKAEWLVRDGATLERYSTLFDDTAEIPYGLGCGGTVDVLLEPAGTPEFEALLRALAASLHGETRQVTSRLVSPTGRTGRVLMRSVTSGRGDVLFQTGSEESGASVMNFDEVLRAPQRLLIFGAGDDAQPVARFAALLGWTVIIVDGRSQWAKGERFPDAEQVIVGQHLENIAVTNDDAVVIMTHSFEQDRAWLISLLPYKPQYLGLLGARHRSALLLTEASERVGWDVERTCKHVFAPIGLDLGGEGAEAIALAIIAEIQAGVEGKLPTARRMTSDSIAEHIARGGASRYQQAQCAL